MRPWSSLAVGDGGADSDRKEHMGGDADGDTNTDGDANIAYRNIVCLRKALTGRYMTFGATLITKQLAHCISDSDDTFLSTGPPSW